VASILVNGEILIDWRVYDAELA